MWEKNLPREMLYQLDIYAVSGIGNKTATILYSYIDDIVSVQKVDVNNPVLNSKLITIILKPINLNKMVELIYSDYVTLVLIKYVDEL